MATDRTRVGCVGAPAFAVASVRGEVFVRLDRREIEMGYAANSHG
jgi:hypothetical protein